MLNYLLLDGDLAKIHVLEEESDVLGGDVLEEDDGVLAFGVGQQALEVGRASRQDQPVCFK